MAIAEFPEDPYSRTCLEMVLGLGMPRPIPAYACVRVVLALLTTNPSFQPFETHVLCPSASASKLSSML